MYKSFDTELFVRKCQQAFLKENNKDLQDTVVFPICLNTFSFNWRCREGQSKSDSLSRSKQILYSMVRMLSAFQYYRCEYFLEMDVFHRKPMHADKKYHLQSSLGSKILLKVIQDDIFHKYSIYKNVQSPNYIWTLLTHK